MLIWVAKNPLKGPKATDYGIFFLLDILEIGRVNAQKRVIFSKRRFKI